MSKDVSPKNTGEAAVSKLALGFVYELERSPREGGMHHLRPHRG